MPDRLRAALAGQERPTLPMIFAHGTRLLQTPLDAAELRIVVAGSATTDLVARAIAVGCALEGLSAAVEQAPFGAWRQEALNPDSALHRRSPQLVVLVTDWREAVAALPLDAPDAAVAASVSAIVAGFRAAWDAIGRTGARIIQHLPGLPPTRLAGIAELRCPASPRRQVEAVRAGLLAAGPEIVFVDAAPLAADARGWFSAKLAFGQNMLVEYVPLFRAALRTATGRGKKLLALDLDNTLWGGVIGDDGVEGIRLGPDTPAGEAFAAFQSHARALAARGIVLAVCSKNDPAIAALGFAHPHTVLARSDFAAFECSWSDKAGGLERIAQALNLGLESIVFADDNPAECALVRERLPQVAVVELGPDPADFIERLEAGRWFELQSLGADDLARGAAYQARAGAQAAQEQSADLGAFLQGLAMRGHVGIAGPGALARVAQLENKTNQFNLTTRRYDEAAVRAFAARDDALVLAGTLADRFGDHGLVSSVIALAEGDAPRIESWLMSCRVFSRSFEQFVMRSIVAEARRRGLARIVGEHVPSPKNGVVADLFERLGFARRDDAPGWSRATDIDTDDLVTFVADS